MVSKKNKEGVHENDEIKVESEHDILKSPEGAQGKKLTTIGIAQSETEKKRRISKSFGNETGKVSDGFAVGVACFE